MAQTHNVPVNADFARLLQKSKAIMANPAAKITPSKEAGSATPLYEEKEIPGALLHVDVTRKYGPAPQSAVPMDAVAAMMAGTLKMGKGVPQSIPSGPAAPDPLGEATRMLEEISAPVAPARNVLTEITQNLRKGGPLKEEIVRIVLEEALTEKTLVPLLQKHFDKLMTNFIAARKKP